MKKQTISLLLSLVLVLSLLSPLSALAAEKSGSAGDQVTWSLDTETGILSFTGSGRMYEYMDYEDDSAPLWWGCGDSIREIRFDEGITSISYGLFSMTRYASCTDMERLRNVRSVRIPASIAWIGLEAFAGCTRLDEIVILNPDCVIEDDAEYSKTLGVPGRTVVVGYPDSTAERYAKLYGYTFRAIGCAGGSHVFSDAVITPQTCTKDGVMESVCVLCGYKTQRAIPAGHDYQMTSRLARTVYTCSRCGESYVAGECKRLKLGGLVSFTVNPGTSPCLSFTPEITDFYNFSLDEYAAHQRYGYTDPFGKIYDSSGAVVSDYSSAILEAGQTYYYTVSHIYDDALQVQAEVDRSHYFVQVSTTATCTMGGSVTETCIACGETVVSQTGPLGHAYEGTVLTEPTCTQEGLIKYTCSRCGKSYNESLPKEHKYVYDDKMPWYEHAVCSVCGDVYTRGTPNPPALTLDQTVSGHLDEGGLCCFRFTPDKSEYYAFETGLFDYSYSGGIYASDGKQVGWFDIYPMAILGEMYEGETYYLVIEERRGKAADFSGKLKIEHDYSSVLTAPASCTSEGLRTYTCRFCGDSYTETLPESHEWDYDVWLPWYRHMTCKLCGKAAESGTQTPPELRLGQEVQPQFNEEHTAFFRFTADKSEAYSLRVAAPYNGEILWYTPDGALYSWGGGSCYLDKGQTVFLKIETYTEDGAFPSVVMELVHDYVYVTTQAPTCTEEGLRVGLCRYCGDYVTEPLPACHDLEYDVLLPWYRHAVCRVCGQSVESGEKNPPELRLGETATARIEEAGGGAYFSFRPAQDAIYSFTFDSTCYCEAMTADGEYYERLTGYRRIDNDHYRYDCPMLGGKTYYFWMWYQNIASTGEVSLKADQVKPITIPELQPDKQIHMSVKEEMSYDFFRITAPETGIYELRFEFEGNSRPYGSLLQDDAGNSKECFENELAEATTLRFRMEAGQSCILRSFSPYPYDLLLHSVDALVDAKPLTLDRFQNAVPETSDGTVYFSYTPEQTGSYEFASSSGCDTYCMLYDADMNWLQGSGESPNGSDFLLRSTLEAGKTYYFGVGCYGSGYGRSIPVRLRQSTNWGSPDYDWYGTDRVTAYCHDIDDFDHYVSETVIATRVVTKEPTYTEPGEEVLIAVFENELFETQTWVRAIPILTASLPCDGVACPCSQFTDMPAKTHWAHDAIDWALVNGVTTGTGETTFSPDAGCTRAQVATFLWRAAGKPEPAEGENPFVDVSADAYYYKAVLWALQQGVTTGTSADKFSPDAVCTRAQIVTFLWRFEGSEAASGAAFTDVPAGAYYETAVAWAAGKGVTTGTGEGTFSPEATCTRAQVVTFLCRDLA